MKIQAASYLSMVRGIRSMYLTQNSNQNDWDRITVSWSSGPQAGPSKWSVKNSFRIKSMEFDVTVKLTPE